MKVQQLTVGSFATNCYLVTDESTREGFVIDPGGDGDRILSEIKKTGMKVKGILLTHGHYDHFAAVDRVAQETKAPVLIHRSDACWYSQIPSFFGPVAPPKTKISGFLEPGQRLRTGELSLEVLATPGHTPGGVSFYGGGVLFCGDTLFWRSVGRCDLPGGNWDTLLSSIRTTLFSLPEDTAVYCGHGPETTIGEEKEQNPYL